MGRLGHFASVGIRGDGTVVTAPASRVGETFDGGADRHHQLVGDHPLAAPAERGGIRHFADHHPGLPAIVGTPRITTLAFRQS